MNLSLCQYLCPELKIEPRTVHQIVLRSQARIGKAKVDPAQLRLLLDPFEHSPDLLGLGQVNLSTNQLVHASIFTLPTNLVGKDVLLILGQGLQLLQSPGTGDHLHAVGRQVFCHGGPDA